MKRNLFYFAAAIMSITLGFYGCSDKDGKPETPDQFSIGANALSFAAAGESKTFAVTANIAWSVAVPSDAASWLSVSPASGNGNQSVTVTATANAATASRSADVTVSAAGFGSAKVTVTQAGAAASAVDAQAPSITAQPVGANYLQNATAAPLTVTASVSDGGILSYQWYSNISNSNSNGTLISGATSASYTPPTNTNGSRFYYVVVTNTNNAATGTKTATTASSAAGITVNAAGTPFVAVMYIGIATTIATAGVPLTLSGAVYPSNATNKTIVWSLGTGSTAAGATVSSGQASATGAGIIKVVATIANGATATTPYTQNFDINVTARPIITKQPENITVVEGQNATFTVEASSTTPMTYQWFKNDFFGEISGATAATLTLTNVTTGMWGSYFCRITNSDGITGSNTALLTVTPATLTVAPTASTMLSMVPTSSHAIISNTNWTASSNQSWCTVTPSSGTGNGGIAVIATSHVPGRTATITIKAGSKTETVTIIQAGL